MFLDKIVTLHSSEQKKNLVASIVTGAAISAATQLILEEGGRVLVFSSNICSNGYGALKQREDPKLYNTPNEAKLLSPEH